MVSQAPMERLAYHLFKAQGFQREYDGSAIFDQELFVGQLFRRSLGNLTVPHMPADDGPATYCAGEGEVCRCSGRVFFGRRLANDQVGGDIRHFGLGSRGVERCRMRVESRLRAWKRLEFRLEFDRMAIL